MCSVTCYYPEPTCFGYLCDHHQGVLLQEHNKYTNNFDILLTVNLNIFILILTNLMH